MEPGQPAEMQQESEVRVETQKIVKYGDKKVWVPQQVEEQGVTYMLLNKWDRHFVMFVHGKPLDLSKKNKSGASLDCPFFDELLQKRQAAFNANVQDLLESDEGDSQPPAKKAKKEKAFKATRKHQAIAPHHTVIELPDVQDMPALTCRVLFEGIGSTVIWVEMVPEILVHIRKGLQQSESKPRKKKATKSD